MIEAILDQDYSQLYTILVWLGVLLVVAWVIVMHDDPANVDLAPWQPRLLRTGVIIMITGFLLSVLFGGDRKWIPWPTSVVVISGFDFFIGSAIYIVRRRTALFKAAARNKGPSFTF